MRSQSGSAVRSQSTMGVMRGVALIWNRIKFNIHRGYAESSEKGLTALVTASEGERESIRRQDAGT